MKRFSLFAAMSFALLGAQAQEATPVAEANRILINTQAGSTGFITDRVTDLTFAKVQGPVRADLKILSSDAILKVSVIRTSDCVAYKLGVIPTVMFKAIGNDAQLISYMNSQKGALTTFHEDYTSAEISGLDLEPGTDYTLLTIGVDTYGVDCEVSAANFTTQGIPVIGNPQVDVKVTDVTTRTISLSFTPNKDVSAYYFVIGPKGSLEEQYTSYAPMFGFKNIGDMVKAWGTENKGPITYQYKDMDPNTEYELYVLSLDVEGTAAPVQIVNVSTANQGGTGIASTEAKVTAYKLSDWDGEMKPSVFVRFTPNAETLAYRFGVYTAASYESQKDAIKDDLCQEPPMPNMAHWFFYDPLETDFQVNPNTEIVICVASKNANHEWGELNVVRYTTPAQASSAPAHVASQRVQKPSLIPSQPGRVPSVSRIQLIPTR